MNDRDEGHGMTVAATLGSEEARLDALMRRIERGGDFPALSEAVGAINRIASSEREGVNALSNTILKDVALTSRLLKLANAAFYNRSGGNTISTVSRAVVILGFDAVRAIALSLILLDNLENKAHAQLLKEAFVKALFAGILARETALQAQAQDPEEAFIGAMLHSLGRMLAMFYLPDDAAEVARLVETEDIDETKAATRVLGVPFERLGMAVARSWGFPESFVLSMRALPAGKVRKTTNDAERLRVLAAFSNELCDAILVTPDGGRAQALAQLGSRFGDCLGLSEKQMASLVENAMQDVSEFAVAVNVSLTQSQFARQAAKWAGVAEAVAVEEDALDGSVLLDSAPARAAAPVEDGAPRTPEAVQALLAAGLQDVSNSLIDDAVSINDILRMILETMFTSMDFAHVVLCVKDARRNTMTGKFGFGEGLEALIPAFDFPLAAKPDVFLVALENNADILISDIDDPKIAARIPGWYRRHVAARTFALFPIVVKGRPVGLIYADRPRPGEIVIPERELALLKSLRNQAVLAIRQSR